MRRSLGMLSILMTCVGLSFAEAVLTFGGADLVEARTPLTFHEGRGDLHFDQPLSPSEGYTGPRFFGGYGRSAHGSVDRAEIDNNTGPYGLDMLGFTEGAMGLVDVIYGAVIFTRESFKPPYTHQPIRLAREKAMVLRTYTGFVPDQEGWVYFYVMADDQRFVGPPMSYTRDTEGDWGEKTLIIEDPRTVAWTRLKTEGETARIAGNREPAQPNFDHVTEVGFFFVTNATTDVKQATRFMTDFFMVSAHD
ncbi:MAG: hypothetical protein JJU05_01800 [Verrucomicrobia bacterium]|nr:hypothetical protein [Verrucomicrobiota bacterium]MCH8526142.1 hypothetical protein [Kiritimatiellia bacterium]